MRPNVLRLGKSTDDTFKKLQGLQVIRASDGSKVELASQWNENETVVLAFARTLGCPFCWELATQLRRDIKPQLDAKDIKLFLVSIGTFERSKDYVTATGFPADNLFLDPDNITYDALGLYKGLLPTFFDVRTPMAIAQRITQGAEDMKDILPRWQPWQPPRQDQALQQGGLFVFRGQQCLFSHFDKATAAHADLQDVADFAQKLAADCGCNPSPVS